MQWTTLTELAPDLWNRINLLFIVFRMPLFFLASGLFASSIIARSWPELWRTRLSLLVWALLLWTIIRFGYFAFLPNPTGIDETNPVDLLLTPVRPSNGLWFLYALALFFVAMKLMRNRIDWRIQLAVAAALSVWFFARADTGNIAWNGMGRYFLFFLLGCFFRDAIMRFVERRGLATGIFCGVAFVALAGAIFAVDARVPAITGVLAAVSLLALAAGLLIARYLTRFRSMSWLAYVGRNTLPVYVLHVLFVSGITSLLLLARGQAWVELLAPVLPLLVAAVAVAAALGSWRATRGLPLFKYGYVSPAWLAGRRASTPLPTAGAAASPLGRQTKGQTVTSTSASASSDPGTSL